MSYDDSFTTDDPITNRRRAGRRRSEQLLLDDSSAAGLAFAQGSTDDRPTAETPPEGERWSTWDQATHGPLPRPPWVVTDLAAVDADLGVLKTGKEADVGLVRRWVPGSSRPAALMAAKRFRTAEHRLFHRDAGYLEGRRVRKSRETRAMLRRTEFGKELISAQWARAEFMALSTTWALDLPVPYPVQLDGREMLMEFIGDADGVAAPRLAGARLTPAELAEAFHQLHRAMTTLAEEGWAHGDLSAYNILWHQGRIVIIDWPQIVDIVGNPQGFDYLKRDVDNVCRWFAAAGLASDPENWFSDLAAAASRNY